MDSLIPVIGKLYELSNSIGIDLNIGFPRMVVVGAQSDGKSSVLEGIARRDFLPRGTGIVTRNPLILHLVHVPLNDPRRQEDSRIEDEDWAVFDHEPHEIYDDFDDVRCEIEKRTQALSGSNKNISKVPIGLTIYSHKVITLSLVDLPGIVKVAVGDQPLDIEEQTKHIVREYITDPNSIILAVTPANQDVANSESLKMAGEVDPEGKRTLVILTKLDLMDKGTDAADILEGRNMPVKQLGIIGVVGRSQLDTKQGKSIEDCLHAEEEFLKQNYSRIAAKNGIKHLSKTLNEILTARIKEALPTLREEVHNVKLKFEEILEGFGERVEEWPDRRKAVLDLISEFDVFFQATIKDGAQNVDERELSCGAKISRIIHEGLRKKLEGVLQPIDLRDVAYTIENVAGTQRLLNTPERAFHLVAQRNSRPLEKTSLECVTMVYEELRENVAHCMRNVNGLRMFPNLKGAISQVIYDFLDDRKAYVKKFIAELIEIQKLYINTQHPEFQKDIKTVAVHDLTVTNEEFFENDTNGTQATEAECRRMADLAQKYVRVLINDIESQVRKAVAGLFLEHTRARVKDKLVLELLNEADVDRLLAEDPTLVKERENAAKMIKHLTSATFTIGEISATFV